MPIGCSDVVIVNYVTPLKVEQGFAAAQCNLGSMHANGAGVEEDHAEACRLYRLASAALYPEAQFSLGCMYANGTGVVQDYATAARLFTAAKEAGFEGAVDALHSVYGARSPTGSYTRGCHWFPHLLA
jgi:TPR repeat protein